MSKQEEKFQSQVEVTSEFVSYYFNSVKGKRKFAFVLEGLNAATTIEDTTDNPERPILVIDADSSQNAEQAKMRVMQALFVFKNRGPAFTHLITFPFTDEPFVNSYLKFKDTVLSTFGHNPDIDESLFQNVKKLHLTVSVLTLVSEEHVSKAKDILRRECHRILESGLDLHEHIQVKGLATMNNDPSHANVLYAMVDDERLQTIADRVAKQMASTGFVFKDNHSGISVKLHITLMNTVYSKRKARKRKLNKGKSVKSFDCTAILEHFKEYIFADLKFPMVQLNDARTENEQGYYKVIDSFQWDTKSNPNNADQ